MGCRELHVNDYFRMTDSASGTDVPYYALADANKNITEYFDSNGNVVAHYEYSPFGKITVSNGAMADDFDYRFSSEVYDGESGLSYYNHRYYSAELGRWLNRDPINELGHILLKQAGRRNPYSNEDDNPFRHTDNDPLNNADTNGESLSCYFLTAAAIVSFISFSVSIPGCITTGAGCIASAGLGHLLQYGVH
jgi:RHS repeat-associated protein